MKFDKSMLLLYAVTDRSWVGKQTLFEQAEQALQGGVTMMQLREKSLTHSQFVEQAKQMARLCHKYDVPLIINDNLAVAIESGADGVHVGITDLSIAEIRKKTNPHFIVGATAKTIEQAQNAQKCGADYLGVGAVFASPTKQNAIRITKDQLKQICNCVDIPVVAIGGITYDNVQQLAGGGMDGIATVSAIFGADDIKTATQLIKNKVLEIL